MDEPMAAQLAHLLSARLVHEMRTAKHGTKFRQVQEILSSAQKLAMIIEDLVKTADKVNE